MSNLSQTGVPGPEGTASLPSPERKTSGTAATTYVVATIACFALAFIIFIIAKPTERTGPPEPQEGTAGAALPQGHPDTATAALLQQLAARVEALRKPVEASPEDGSLRLELANTLYDLGLRADDVSSFEEAAVHYAKYLEINPGDPDARTDLAATLAGTGRLDEAITELYKVRKSHPNHQHSAFNLGLMYKEKDKPDSLLAYMEITARIDSTTNAGRTATEVLKAYRESHSKTPPTSR